MWYKSFWFKNIIAVILIILILVVAHFVPMWIPIVFVILADACYLFYRYLTLAGIVKNE